MAAEFAYDDEAFREVEDIVLKSQQQQRAVNELITQVQLRMADSDALHLLGDDDAADGVWLEIRTYLRADPELVATAFLQMLARGASDLAAKYLVAHKGAIEEAIAEPECPAPFDHDRNLRSGETWWRRPKNKPDVASGYCGWCGGRRPVGGTDV